jgi:hypothetical protein
MAMGNSVLVECDMGGKTYSMNLTYSMVSSRDEQKMVLIIYQCWPVRLSISKTKLGVD